MTAIVYCMHDCDKGLRHPLYVQIGI